MNVVDVLGQNIVVVDELLRIGAGSGNTDEAELAHDLFDVFVFPQTRSPEGLEQVRAAQQLQLYVRIWMQM